MTMATLPPSDDSGRDPSWDDVDAQPTQSYESPSPANIPTGDVSRAGGSSSAYAGQMIAGKFRLVEPIGQGGMGSVWRADQTAPMKRPVALKLIRSGLDSTSMLLRFEAERQALALMDHPCIASIYDGGLDQGMPFFAMEMVDGEPITTYCDRHCFPPRRRVELFVQVCQAIQHAHQKGIIHRDLKPGNVLVTEVDGHPVPKVIDFGVAKATEQKLVDATLEDLGMLLGTPAYMSPEQADPNNLDIDTRSDVYALGVMLYELLTGSPPIDASQFRRGMILEVLRMVRESEPPIPSQRVSTAEALPKIAAQRGVDPAQLKGGLRGDLDWIVMKALEKDRDRRYDTATGFALDLQRHLAHEPVMAAPPSRRYRLQKFVRKHRGPVLAASLVFLSLIGGIIGTSMALGEAQRQRNRAEAEVVEKEQARAAEVNEREKAERRLVQVKSGISLLTSIFQDLDIGTPQRSKEPLERVLAERLKAAAEKSTSESLADPFETASMQASLGQALTGLGNPSEALPLMKTAYATMKEQVGESHGDTIRAQFALGACLMHAGEVNAALPTLVSAVELATLHLGERHPDTMRGQGILSNLHARMGNHAESLRLREEGVQYSREINGPDHPETLQQVTNLAAAYIQNRQLKRGEEILVENYQKIEEALGPGNKTTLNTMNSIAATLYFQGDISGGLRWMQKTVDQAMTHLGADHDFTLSIRRNLAIFLEANGKVVESLEVIRDVEKTTREKLGEQNDLAINMAVTLGSQLLKLDRAEEAYSILYEARSRAQKALGEQHETTIDAMALLGEAQVRLERSEEGLATLETAHRLARDSVGKQHLKTLAVLSRLAMAYEKGGKWDPALELQQELLSIYKTEKANQPDRHRYVGPVLRSIAMLYDKMQRPSEASETSLELLDMLASANYEMNKAELIVPRSIDLIEKSGNFPEAETRRRDWIAHLVKRRGEGAFAVATERFLLGQNLAQQERYDEGEDLLLASFKIIQEQSSLLDAKAPMQLNGYAKVLADFYRRWGKPEDASQWEQTAASLDSAAAP